MMLRRWWLGASATFLLLLLASFEVEAQTCGDFTDGLSGEVELPPSTCYKMRMLRQEDPDAAEFGEACLEIVENDEGKKCVSAQFTVTQDGYVFQKVKIGVRADCGGFMEFGGTGNSIYDVSEKVLRPIGEKRTSMTLEYCLDEVDVVSDCCNQSLCFSLFATVMKRKSAGVRIKRNLVSDNLAGRSDCEIDDSVFQAFAPRCQAILGCGDATSGSFEGFEAVFSAEVGKVTASWLPALGAVGYEVLVLEGEVEIDPETVDVVDLREAALMTKMESGFATTTTFSDLDAGLKVTLFVVARFEDGRVENADASEMVFVAALDPIFVEGVRVLDLFNLTVEWDGTGEMMVMNPGNMEIAEGNILHGVTNDEELSFGFLVYVEEVVSTGAPTVLVVREATINEVFKQLDLSCGYTLRNASEGTLGENTTTSPSRMITLRQIIDNPDLDKKYAISSKLNYNVDKLSMSLEMGASLRVAARLIIRTKVDLFDFSMTGELKGSAIATFALFSGVRIMRKATLYKFAPKNFIIPVFGVGIPIRVTSSFDYFLDGSAEPVSYELEIGRVLKWSMLVSYRPGTGLTRSSDASDAETAVNITPSVLANAEIETGFQLSVDARISGIIGVKMKGKISGIVKFAVDITSSGYLLQRDNLGTVFLTEYTLLKSRRIEIRLSTIGEEFLSKLFDFAISDFTLTPLSRVETRRQLPSIDSLALAIKCYEGFALPRETIVIRVSLEQYSLGLDVNFNFPSQWAYFGEGDAIELRNVGESLEVYLRGINSLGSSSDLPGLVAVTIPLVELPDMFRVFMLQELSSLPSNVGAINCISNPTPEPQTPTPEPKTPTPMPTPSPTPMPTPSPTPMPTPTPSTSPSPCPPGEPACCPPGQECSPTPCVPGDPSCPTPTPCPDCDCPGCPPPPPPPPPIPCIGCNGPPPPPCEICTGGGCGGDPHLITMDGIWFSCHGSGEYILVEDPSLNLRVHALFRRLPYQGPSPPPPVSVVSGFAAQQGEEPVRQMIIEKDTCKYRIFYDGEEYPISLAEREEGFHGMRVLEEVDGAPSRGFLVTGGVNIAFSVRGGPIPEQGQVGCFLVAFVGLEEYSPQARGLLGTPNNDPLDDWIMRDGTVLPLPTDKETARFKPAYDYCTQNWCVTEEADSIMVPVDHPDFAGLAAECSLPYEGVSSFEEFKEFATTEMLNICGNNDECLIDAVTLQNPDEGRATLVQMRNVEKIRKGAAKFWASPIGVDAGVSTDIVFVLDLNRLLDSLPSSSNIDPDAIQAFYVYSIDSITQNLGASSHTLYRSDEENVFKGLRSVFIEDAGDTMSWVAYPVISGFENRNIADLVVYLMRGVQAYSAESNIDVTDEDDDNIIDGEGETIRIESLEGTRFEIEYSWPGDQKDLDSATSFLDSEVGYLCEGSTYMEYSGDNRGTGGLERVYVDVMAAEIDDSLMEIRLSAHWNFHDEGEGPITIRISIVQTRSGSTVPNTTVVTTATPVEGWGCSKHLLKRIVIRPPGITGDGFWEYTVVDEEPGPGEPRPTIADWYIYEYYGKYYYY